jgi:hypothetical protein
MGYEVSIKKQEYTWRDQLGSTDGNGSRPGVAISHLPNRLNNDHRTRVLPSLRSFECRPRATEEPGPETHYFAGLHQEDDDTCLFWLVTPCKIRARYEQMAEGITPAQPPPSSRVTGGTRVCIARHEACSRGAVSRVCRPASSWLARAGTTECTDGERDYSRARDTTFARSSHTF